MVIDDIVRVLGNAINYLKIKDYFLRLLRKLCLGACINSMHET